MEPITEKLIGDWSEIENTEFMQGRHRRYLHFDSIIENLTAKTLHKIGEPSFITKYSFFPFIRRASKVRLYKKDPVTNKKKIVSKIRPICYAAHFDSLVYSWYAYQLSHFYETAISGSEVDTCAIAYRKLEKSNLNFAKEVFDFIGNQETCVAVAFDIKGFYDNLNFELLKKSWALVLGRKDLTEDHYAVYRAVTRFSFVDYIDIIKLLGFKQSNPKYQELKPHFNHELIKLIRENNLIKSNKNVGVPQGAPISCVLSNIYMLGFDQNMIKKVATIKGMYRRYSDDIIIVCSESDLKGVIDYIKDEIAKVKLKIEDTKTEIRFFRKQYDVLSCYDQNGKLSKLQYLGVNFDGKDFSLRHKGYAKFERRMVRAVKSTTSTAQKQKRGVPKRSLYERFTPFGETNYVTYAKRAAIILKTTRILESVSKRRLIKKIKERINETLSRLK